MFLFYNGIYINLNSRYSFKSNINYIGTVIRYLSVKFPHFYFFKIFRIFSWKLFNKLFCYLEIKNNEMGQQIFLLGNILNEINY